MTKPEAAAMIESPPAGERRPLFKTGAFTSHSGAELRWKIECDALTPEDWRALGEMAREIMPPFGEVVGVPQGGLAFANGIAPWRDKDYGTDHPRLIVDDVLTTGASMREAMTEPTDIGLVVFARGPLPPRVTALFAMPSAQSSPPGGEIQGLVERAMALANAATPGEWAAVHNGYYWELQTRSPDWPRMGVGDTCESSVIFAKDGSKADHGEANAAFIAASRQLIPELCEAITRLSQPSGEEIREAAAKIADENSHKALASRRYGYVLASVSNRWPQEAQEARNKHLVQVACLWRDFAASIRAMPLPLSSGSNKSDDGKKGQAG